MAKISVRSIANALTDTFSDVWKLLSETSNFLSRTQLFDQYEAQLRSWRSSLQTAPKDSELIREIRQDIVELRKSLRLQGYDLSLGSQHLKFDGFRNDASIRDGYRRLVLFLADGGVYYLSGSDNHISLCEYLDRNLERAGVRQIRERHFLWYLRDGNTLILCGSDTETKEDFERLSQIGNANPLFLLSALKALR